MESDRETRFVISMFAGFVFSFFAFFYHLDLEYKSKIINLTSAGKIVIAFSELALVITGLGFFLYAAYEFQEDRINAYYTMGLISVIYCLSVLFVMNI